MQLAYVKVTTFKESFISRGWGVKGYTNSSGRAKGQCGLNSATNSFLIAVDLLVSWIKNAVGFKEFVPNLVLPFELC